MTDDLVARLRGLAPDSDMPATRSAMLEAAHVIEYERASRAKAENERDDASKALENLLDPKVQSMRLENGKFDVALCGEVVQRLAVIVTGWFRESGAKNYVEMTLNARDEPFERYTFTVQKRGDGAQSPHELRLTAEARVRELEAELAEAYERAAKVADEHRAHVPNHDPEMQSDDLVVQGYGNAAFNIAVAIRNLAQEERHAKAE